MQFPIRIQLRRSRLLLASVTAMHGAAAICLLALPLPVTLRFLLLILVSIPTLFVWRRPSIAGLRITSAECAEWILQDGQALALTVLPETSATRYWVALRARIEDRKLVASAALLPDQMTSAEFRQLRVWLRWHREKRPTAKVAADS
ncbi:protein YgfX [Propionivibrio soli]|uniref:protein YgfX n=1 Tax=Propionivibrio soli TaxID=2976531 RepID=UPI003B84A402